VVIRLFMSAGDVQSKLFGESITLFISIELCVLIYTTATM